jgi:ATP adenylyltransferase
MPPTPSPTYQRLRDTIAKRMRMSHVYQPLMLMELMELLGRRSPAPAQNVAPRILGEDVTQIDYYTERVKRMVGKVHLQRHHPLRPGRLRPCGRRRRRLLRSSRAERRRARRAAATVPPTPRCLPNAARRGGGLFAHAEACGFGHRSRHRTPISGSTKVRAWGRWVGVAPAGMECGGGADRRAEAHESCSQTVHRRRVQ